MVYKLTKMNKEGTSLRANNTYYSDGYAQEMCRLYLTDELVRTNNAKHPIITNYRLHAMQPHSIEMALAYDIHCPKCGNRMKQIGRSLSAHELGLYTCKSCNER